MKGNNLLKLARLLSYLASHPSMISLYFRESINRKVTPLSLGLPWISYTAIYQLELLLQKHHVVAEFGGGGSTLFFADRVHSVLCIESYDVWAKKINHELSIKEIRNVTLELFPYDPSDVTAYEMSENLNRIRDNVYDIILVDGYEENVELRPTCFWKAEKSIKQGGIIIVDDSWRYHQIRQNNRAKRWEVYKSIGPCRPGVTTTDIYYY